MGCSLTLDLPGQSISSSLKAVTVRDPGFLASHALLHICCPTPWELIPRPLYLRPCSESSSEASSEAPILGRGGGRKH